jgi:hypothetical protein
MTHCGSRAAKLAVLRNSSSSYVLGWRYETTGVHHASRRCGIRVAARGARAAAGDAGDRVRSVTLVGTFAGAPIEVPGVEIRQRMSVGKLGINYRF